ncbi:hypothetical protein LIER_25682 [Lithospermum erythrorhizon]|uniref:Uncharacterized protein n=1 Tax=Lithospermum erythrorhizon TaxID=34254 RepID=A0AAV3R9D1_LITER
MAGDEAGNRPYPREDGAATSFDPGAYPPVVAEAQSPLLVAPPSSAGLPSCSNLAQTAQTSPAELPAPADSHLSPLMLPQQNTSTFLQLKADAASLVSHPQSPQIAPHIASQTTGAHHLTSTLVLQSPSSSLTNSLSKIHQPPQIDPHIAPETSGDDQTPSAHTPTLPTPSPYTPIPQALPSSLQQGPSLKLSTSEPQALTLPPIPGGDELLRPCKSYAHARAHAQARPALASARPALGPSARPARGLARPAHGPPLPARPTGLASACPSARQSAHASASPTAHASAFPTTHKPAYGSAHLAPGSARPKPCPSAHVSARHL